MAAQVSHLTFLALVQHTLAEVVVAINETT